MSSFRSGSPTRLGHELRRWVTPAIPLLATPLCRQRPPRTGRDYCRPTARSLSASLLELSAPSAPSIWAQRPSAIRSLLDINATVCTHRRNHVLTYSACL